MLKELRQSIPRVEKTSFKNVCSEYRTVPGADMDIGPNKKHVNTLGQILQLARNKYADFFPKISPFLVFIFLNRASSLKVDNFFLCGENGH